MERFDWIMCSPPCTCEECRPGPGIDYAGKELARVLKVQADARRRRAERRMVTR
jgi:hypothetical protein